MPNLEAAFVGIVLSAVDQKSRTCLYMPVLLGTHISTKYWVASKISRSPPCSASNLISKACSGSLLASTAGRRRTRNGAGWLL